jgi:predicted PurR-regulated permease PerM
MITNSSSVTKKLIALLLVLVLLYVGKDFLMPLTIGGILAALFLPLCKRLEGRKIYKGIAALTCLLLLLFVIVGFIGLLGWEISGLTNDFAMMKQKTIENGDKIQEYIFNHLGISLEKQSQILKDEQPSIAGIMQKVGGSFSYLFTNFILVLVYVFLMLFYRIHIRNFILKLTIQSDREKTLAVVYSVTQVSQQYLLGLFKIIFCLSILYGIAFSILGIRNAIFFAMLCGLLNIIPFVGNIIGALLTVLVATIQGAGLPIIVSIVVIYGVIQFIDGWVLEPLVLGHQVKVNPLFTIVALVLGELLWGIPGIFLAIPLAAMIKTVCDHIESLKPYGFLIGEVENEENKLSIIKKVKHYLNKQEITTFQKHKH